MSGQFDPEKLASESKVIMNTRRLTTISNALKSMETNAKKYLKEYEYSPDYRSFRTALRALEFDQKLENLVEFKLCDLADPENSFYKQSEKKIVICYNKVRDYAHFGQIMKTNLVYLYDDTRARINWYDCSQLACMKIRGLHLSNICQKGNKACFETAVKQSLERSEVCKGKFNEYFETTFQQCLQDISPINSLLQTKKTIFF